MAITTGLAAALAKIAGLSVAAKATAGVTIAVASIGAAGAAGVLPDKMQDGLETVVQTVVPGEHATPDDNAEFGQRVSEDARDGGVDGEEISEEARQQGELRRPEHVSVPDPAEGEAPSELPTPDQPGSQGGSGGAPVDPPQPTPPAAQP